MSLSNLTAIPGLFIWWLLSDIKRSAKIYEVHQIIKFLFVIVRWCQWWVCSYTMVRLGIWIENMKLEDGYDFTA